MRIIGILALALTLAACTGDRLRQSANEQPARGGAHRGCPESRNLRQRQLSAAAVWPPRSRVDGHRSAPGLTGGFLEMRRGVRKKVARRYSCEWPCCNMIPAYVAEP